MIPPVSLRVKRHGVNGFLCENTPEDLASVIQDALSDPERLKAIGQKAKETIPIPWSRLVDDVVAGYEDLLRRYHL